MRRRAWLRGAGAALLTAAAPAGAAPPVIVLASTTSTEQSGLFGHLLPRFRQATGIEVRVVAVGTGQAMDIARRGDADALLVHDQAAEEAFVAEGHGLRRVEVMVNDFVLVGPRADPAGARGGDIVAALRRIAAVAAPFVSRGDRSGTHLAEQRFWALAGGAPSGRAYRECGCGMGQALNVAAALGAYTLADRATWASFRNRADLAVLVQGDARLRNPYAAIVVNPRRHPHVRAEVAQRFVDWLASAQGQAAIASFRRDGQPVFEPVAAGR